MPRRPIGLKLDDAMLDQIEKANGHGATRTDFIEKALRAALGEDAATPYSEALKTGEGGWCPEPDSPFYRTPAECLAAARRENEWQVQAIERDTTRWQAAWDGLRLKLREQRLELLAEKPKWKPPPFGKLLARFYTAADAAEAGRDDAADLLAGYREACEARKVEVYAERAAWHAEAA